MRRGDETNPRGQGSERGGGLGGQGGRGRSGGFDVSFAGYCVCPNCGQSAPHQLRSRCYNQKCPKCGTAMTLEVFQ
jgi:hypothetical protein